MLRALTMENIPNYRYISDDFKGENVYYEPQDGKIYSVPYFYGQVGIIYNTEMVPEDTETLGSWELMWDENFKGDKCSVVFKKTKYVPDLTDEQIKNLPAEFVVEKVIPEQHILRADKNAIKNAVKDGWVINGVSVEERVKVIIK